MPTIRKVTITVTSAYAAAPASMGGGISHESWGCVTLWDIRPFMPWNSRGLIGATGWEGYLSRTAVMNSPADGDGYSGVTQGPKSWAKKTKTVTIYDATGPGGAAPSSAYKPESQWNAGGGGPVYIPDSTSSTAAFSVASAQNFVDTLVVAVYVYNSWPPSLGGPSLTDTVNLYDVYLDVTLDTGTTRFRPTATVTIAGGPNVGVPTGVLNAANAIDGSTSTSATVQETNAEAGGFAALWKPCVFLIEKWSWGKVLCNDPPPGDLHIFYSHTFALDGGTAPFTWTISSGTLPPGLTLNGSTGVLSGTPPGPPGHYTFTITVMDASGITSSVTCTILIRGGAGWLDLWVWRPLEQADDPEQDLMFPPGYARALMLQLAHDFGRQYPGHDLSKINAQLAAAIALIETEDVSNSVGVEELPPPESV